jgi:FHA domain
MALPIEIGERPIAIGRGDDAGVMIDDGRLSRRHVEISRIGERWQLRDLDSHNGTFVDGRPIDRPVELAVGDLRVVRVGDTLLVPHRDLAMVAGGVAIEAGIVVGAALREIARAIAAAGDCVHLVGERGAGKRVAAIRAGGRLVDDDAVTSGAAAIFVAGTRTITATRCDPRVLAANGVLAAELAGGAIVAVPPLRDRPHELPYFAQAALAARSAKLVAHTSLIEQMLARSWPGNARELFDELGAAAAVAIAASHEVVTAEHLAATAGVTLSGVHTPLEPLDRDLELDPNVVATALGRTGGDVDAAARVLNVHRTELRRFLAKRDA